MIGNLHGGSATGGDIVSGSYEAESDCAGDEAHSTKITVKLSVDAACMFNAIASRFGNTRFKLLESHFDVLATQMFNALHDGDKEEISNIADLEATELLFKQGVTKISTVGAAGSFENESSSWRNHFAYSKQVWPDELKDDKC